MLSYLHSLLLPVHPSVFFPPDCQPAYLMCLLSFVDLICEYLHRKRCCYIFQSYLCPVSFFRVFDAIFCAQRVVPFLRPLSLKQKSKVKRTTDTFWSACYSVNIQICQKICLHKCTTSLEDGITESITAETSVAPLQLLSFITSCTRRHLFIT